MPMSTSQNCCCQCLCLHSEAQPLTILEGGAPTPAGRSSPISMWAILFSPGFWVAHYPLCALQEWIFYFSQSCGSLAIKSCWPSKPDSLGDCSSSYYQPPSPVQRGCCRAQNLHSLWRNSVVQSFSGLWVAHLVDMVMIQSLLQCSHYLDISSPLSLDVGYLSWQVPAFLCQGLLSSQL